MAKSQVPRASPASHAAIGERGRRPGEGEDFDESKNPEAATSQVKDMVRFRESSTPQMKKHFLGVTQTIWSGSGGFLDQYYGRRPANDQRNPGHTESKCFVRMFEEIANLK